MKTQTKTRTGIPGTTVSPWGEHLCAVYHSPNELLNLVTPYIQAGLEQNEYCMWITGGHVTEGEAFRALERLMPDVNQYLIAQQLEILPHTQWYLPSGVFEVDIVLQSWLAKAQHAVHKGFDGIRITGNPFWLQSESDWSKFGEYERAVHQALRGERVIALCTYPSEICRSHHIMQILSTHGTALMPHQDHWEPLLLTAG